MTASFEHVLLTRFNLRAHFRSLATITSPEWLEHRFRLFEDFCYPSVRCQSQPGFKWLVFFDALTPESFRSRVRRYAEWDTFVPIYVEELSLEKLRSAVSGIVQGSSTHLITTRLDNDDAIHRDFVARVQGAFEGQRLEFVNFTYGYAWYKGRVYLRRDLSNAFASLIELREDCRTIWCREHTALSEVGPIRQIDRPPAWVQVVHETNVTNRVRGIRQAANVLGEDFPIAALQAADDRDSAFFWLDRHALCPLRGLRDFLIHMAKAIRDTLLRSAHRGR